MKRLKKLVDRTLGKLSPEMVEHGNQLCLEAFVTGVHLINSRRCRFHHDDSKKLKLNLGCGPYSKKGFLNLDFSKSADYRLDLRRKLPFPDESCRLIFSEHFVEHLAYPEGVERLFSDCFRLLEPGGKVSFSVPDTDWPLETFRHEENEWILNSRANGWHPAECSTYMEHLNYHFRQRWRGRSYGHFENHRFAWDFATMEKKLAESGFVEVRKRQFDSTLDSEHRKVGSLFVEATKPDAA